MCAKCYELYNSFNGRYGKIIEAANNGTLDENKDYFSETEVCEEYKKMMGMISSVDDEKPGVLILPRNKKPSD